MMARISIVMPCYNAERFIVLAIQSILDQTYQDFEIIVVDDGSTDTSPQIVKAIDDPRVRYLSQKNAGPARARNTAIQAAVGEYLAFLDADDLMLPHRLAAQLAVLDADPALSGVGSGYVWIDEQGQPLPWPYHSWQRTPDLNDITSWLFDCPFVPSAVMLRRQAWVDVGGFDEDLVGPEDWNFWMRLVVTRHRLTWHPEVVCLYRRSSGSLSEDAPRMAANCPEALRRVLDRPDFPPDILPLGRKALAVRHIDGAKRLYRSGMWDQGQADLSEAITLDPELIRPCGIYPSRIEDELVSNALDPLVKDPGTFIQTVLQHLPENAQVLHERAQHIVGRTHLELLARGLQEGKYSLVLKQWLPNLMRHPGWLVNRTMWGIVVRAVGNRVHGPTTVRVEAA
jgi:glycosyltransferase involved in cell wall biosynthesis